MATLITSTENFNQKAPERGILSETLLKNKHTALVMMHLSEGEELNEHTSKFPVLINTLDGHGELTTPSGVYDMKPGNWLYLEPSEEHAVRPLADHSVRFILVVMKNNPAQ